MDEEDRRRYFVVASVILEIVTPLFLLLLTASRFLVTKVKQGVYYLLMIEEIL
jgi:hypothetical protein